MQVYDAGVPVNAGPKEGGPPRLVPPVQVDARKCQEKGGNVVVAIAAGLDEWSPAFQARPIDVNGGIGPQHFLHFRSSPT